MEKKYFDCEGFEHIICHCKNKEEERLTAMLSNRFEVLESRVINIEERSRKKIEEDKKTILREERLKKKKRVEV